MARVKKVKYEDLPKLVSLTPPQFIISSSFFFSTMSTMSTYTNPSSAATAAAALVAVGERRVWCKRMLGHVVRSSAGFDFDSSQISKAD